jgi:hypothetical protein
MKKTRLGKLALDRETIRVLAGNDFKNVNGGISGIKGHCKPTMISCGVCHDSLNNSACAACASDVDCPTNDPCFDTFLCGGGNPP